MSRADGVQLAIDALCAVLAAIGGAFLFLILGFVFLLVAPTYRPAHGQEHQHAQYHAHYQSWVNKDNKGCCNDRHCKPIADADERTSGGFLEVKIEETWCPVLGHHFLKQGNVPDASVSHVCAWGQNDSGWQDKGPCQRLLCYQPKPGS